MGLRSATDRQGSLGLYAIAWSRSLASSAFLSFPVLTRGTHTHTFISDVEPFSQGRGKTTPFSNKGVFTDVSPQIFAEAFPVLLLA